MSDADIVVFILDRKVGALPHLLRKQTQVRRGKVGQAKRGQIGVAKLEQLRTQREKPPVATHVAELDEGVEETPGRGAIEAGHAGDFAERQARIVRVEGAQHGKPAFEALHEGAARLAGFAVLRAFSEDRDLLGLPGHPAAARIHEVAAPRAPWRRTPAPDLTLRLRLANSMFTI